MLFQNINEGINCKMFLLWLYPQTHQLAIFTYSMKRIAFVSNQGLTFLGFFPYAILYSQSWINNPDPQMFFFYEKKDFMMAVFMDGVQLPQGQNKNHFEEAVYILPLSSQKLLVLIFLSRSGGQTTQILKPDPKKGVQVVAKMLFSQVDEGFWLYYTSF